MRYLKGFNESNDNEYLDIIDNCLDILIDITDNYIPVDVKKGSVYDTRKDYLGNNTITIEIGDNNENQMRKRFWSFYEYSSEFLRLNEYLESENYYLVDGFIYYDLYYDRGDWFRTTRSFKNINDLISILSNKDEAEKKGWHSKGISFIDLIYKNK